MVVTQKLQSPKVVGSLLLKLYSMGFQHFQRAKKVVSDSPGLVDFAIGLVNSVFNLPDRQVMSFEEFK